MNSSKCVRIITSSPTFVDGGRKDFSLRWHLKDEWPLTVLLALQLKRISQPPPTHTVITRPDYK